MASTDETRFDHNLGAPTPGPLGDVGDILYKGLQVLASLKITVGTFAFGIILILVGTLAQVDLDIHVVLDQYFRAWIARVPLQVFLPITFFPSNPQIGGWFWFPGGKLIGTVMFVNLTAAHAVRFKIQAAGSRLWTGVGVIALGALTTYMVILSGSNKDGVQDKAWMEWSTLWQILKFGLGAAWVAIASSLLKIDAKRKLERWAIIALTLLLGVGVIFLFYMGDDAKLKDESMRILWQLIKAEAAAILLLVGCIMVFKKRAGVVVLHAGIGLMMFNELLVYKTAVEAQMPINEGETVNYVLDPRHAELAIVDTSLKDHDAVTVIPGSRLRTAGQSDDKDGQTIDDDQLPFKVRVLKYIPNSRYHIARSSDPNSPVTIGGGLRMWIVEVPSSTGTDSDQKFDAPSAYIEFLDKKTSASLGVYLMSLHMKEQTVRLGKKEYEVALRFKRTYKPYSMHLIEVRSDKYLGTDINRNYSSELRLVGRKEDGKDDAPRNVKIWMNNPLRYAGETFYQSGYNPPSPLLESAVDSETGMKTGLLQPKFVDGRPVLRASTTLQVVTNTGWMIPYVGCMIVGTGMLAHFWIVLLRFLSRRLSAPTTATSDSAGRHKPAKRAKQEEVFEPELAQPTSFLSAKRAAVWFPAVVAGVMGLYLMSKMIVRPVKVDDVDLNAVGKLPVVANARTKPLDSLARNALRSMSARQTFDDANGDKQPAIRWLMDVITDHEKAKKYQVFRIENLEVLSMLGLASRPGYRYSMHELETKDPDFVTIKEQSDKARELPGKKRSVFQRKVLALATTIGEYRAIERAFVLPPKDVNASEDELRLLVILYQKQSRSVPLVVPDVGDEDEPWKALSESSSQLWVRRYSKAHNLTSLDDLATRLALERDGRTVHRDAARAWISLSASEFMRRRENVTRELAVRTAEFGWLRFPPERKRAEAIQFLRGRLDVIMQGQSLKESDPPETVALVKILTAYRDRNAEDYNAGIEEYQKVLAELQPKDYEPAKLKFENWFNHFEPFFYSSFLYLVAFVLGVGAWMGWSQPLRRSSFCLILMAFAVHTFSLIARMYISGRWGVTVTNLYSSAIFIGWAACLLGILLEIVYPISIGNVVAGAAGFGALLIAHFLSLDGDTIAVMQAVLDTNFWLATHVTTITLGYATTYIAGLLGIVYIFLGLFTNQLGSEQPHPLLVPTSAKLMMRFKGGTLGKTLLSMMYGTLCFAIFFSFVGTVLGGLWADDSWGRFWGWDPKENGALIIVLWNALVLHARWGNMVKDRGMAVLVVGGNIVTSWSWFGVNLLGVGLHSYGFQEGVGLALAVFCASQIAVIGLGCAPREMWRSFRDELPTHETAA